MGKYTDILRMVILVRTDLDMKKGKMAVQTAHAVLGAYRKAKRAEPELVADWERTGEKKITLKVGSQQELIDWRSWADSQGLPSYLVKDAGLTQLEPGTMTALAIGPAEPDKLRKTEQLQLL